MTAQEAANLASIATSLGIIAKILQDWQHESVPVATKGDDWVRVVGPL